MTNHAALAAHARLSALTTSQHLAEPEERRPSSLVGYPTEGKRGGRPASPDSPLRARAASSSPKALETAPAMKRPRKQRDPSTFKGPPNRLGFTRGDTLAVADDGKSWGGMTVEFYGMASSTWCYVISRGIKTSVRADRLRRAG